MTGDSEVTPPVMHRGRRTKIVATIGPATRSVDTMAELITAGADVLRLNFSHGTRDEHAENIEMARRASELAGRQVGVLGDLPGPKLRLDEVEGGVVELQAGAEVTLKRQPLGHNLAQPDLQATAHWLREHFAREAKENAA